jgi:DNA repair exonuclease SbcCD ATPase subunit
LVNDVYEDESGQNIINEKFGKKFDICSYIAQNSYKNFVLMSPLDKLNFIENIAFNNVNLSEIKLKLKRYISDCSQNLSISSTKLDTTRQIFNNMIYPTKSVFPVKCKPNQIPVVIKNVETRSRQQQQKLVKLNDKLEKLKKQLSNIMILSTELANKQQQIEKINNDIMEKNKERDEILEKYKGDDSLSSLQKKLELFLISKKILLLKDEIKQGKTSLDDMYQEEIEHLNLKKLKLEKKLWKEMSSQDLNTNLQELKSFKADMLKIEMYKSQISENTIDQQEITDNENEIIRLKQQLKYYKELQQQQNTYECPCCNVVLKLETDRLVKYTATYIESNNETRDTIASAITNISNEISLLENKNYSNKKKLESNIKLTKKIDDITQMYEEIISVDQVDDNIKYFEDYKTQQKMYQNKLNEIVENITNKNLSSSYFNFKRKLEKKQKRLESLCNSNVNTEVELLEFDINDEESLRNDIIQQNTLKHDLEINTTQIEKQQKELVDINIKISRLEKSHLLKYKKIRNAEIVEEMISSQAQDITETIQEKTKFELLLQKIEYWKKYKSELDNYNNLNQKIKQLEQLEISCRNKYNSSLKLKEKIIEAESVYMINIINLINIHAKMYLDNFFSENPIIVELQTYKKTSKKIKPQINLLINYKSMEADLSMLSGGEISRVILAFTLALGEIFSSPIMLLDECTSSLDQDLNEEIIESIKQNFKGKYTLIIAHQTINGKYDNVVNV